MQRFLIIIGAALLLTGLVWPWIEKLGLGRLPGDIVIERAGLRFYFPVMTCLLISVLLTILLSLFRR